MLKFWKLLIPFTLATLMLAGCGGGNKGRPSATGRIGIYNGSGAWPEFAGAVKAALDSLGRDTEYIDEADAQGGLDGISMVVFGGGDPLQTAAALGFTGRENVRQLVSGGGGFLGLGGGAYLAADTMIYDGDGSLSNPPIGLFHGLASGPINALAPQGSYTMALIEITDTRFDPDLTGSIESLYRGGPEWLIDTPPYDEIAHFVQTNHAAGVVFTLGAGRVGLLAFQPEIEEDNPRDGTTFGDNLDDPDSEWFLLRSVTEWCLREF